MTPRAAVIMAAGQGTRMKSPIPKVLHKVGGRAILDRVIDTVEAAGCERIIVVVGNHSPGVRALVEARLGASAYFAGDEFSAADIIMGFALTTMRVFAPRDLSPYPNILAYLKVIGARPAYQRAMEKGDPQLTPLLS